MECRACRLKRSRGDGNRLPAAGTAAEFFDLCRKHPALKAAGDLYAAFDLDPATSLHLTYHLLGDSEDRGKALARLLWVYHREGYDAVIGELPDYLPMILEFLALCPEPEDATLLWSCLWHCGRSGRTFDKK